MATVDLKEFPGFRANALQLSDDLKLMVESMDPGMGGDLSEAEKTAEISKLLTKYLPQ